MVFFLICICVGMQFVAADFSIYDLILKLSILCFFHFKIKLIFYMFDTYPTSYSLSSFIYSIYQKSCD